MVKVVNIGGESESFRPPAGDVVVKVDFIDHEISDGGIFIPIKRLACTDRPTHGKVIRVGEGVKDVKVGDIVHWSEVSGMDFEFDDCKCTVLQEKAILCIVE